MYNHLMLVILSSLAYIPSAFANTGASALAMPIGASLLFFPFVWWIEGRFYLRRGDYRPYRKSLLLNTISTLVGNIIALVLALTVLLGPTYLMFMQVDSALDFLRLLISIFIHYTLSVVIEYGASRIFLKERNPRKIFIANAISYLCIFLFYGVLSAVMKMIS